VGRTTSVFVTAALVALVVTRPARSTTTSAAPLRCSGVKDADVLVARGRQAVGSASHKLVSFWARGRTQPVRPTFMPTVVQFAAIMPDRFVRLSWEMKRPNIIDVLGFNGSVLLTDVRGPVKRDRGPTTPEDLERTRRAVATYLMGWFMLPMPGSRETFRFSGEVVYRGRPAVLLRLVDSPMWLRSLWLDRDSCLPLGIVSEVAGGARDEPDPGASAPGFVRTELAFLDRRSTSGFQAPYRIQTYFRAAGLSGRVNIEQFEINGKVDADLFRPPAR